MSIKIVIIYNAEYQINQTHGKQKSVEALHITQVSKYKIKLKVTFVVVKLIIQL